MTPKLVIRHDFPAAIRWTGNRGHGTATYDGYDRSWRLETAGKVEVECSNDPRLGGDPSRHNPEDLFVAAIASCHMLWYLHLAANAGIVVNDYRDEPVGHGESSPDGSGQFTSVTLHPQVTVAAGSNIAVAERLHDEVHRYCFIARSVGCAVRAEPTIVVGG